MPNKYDNQHLKNVHKYAADVARLYDEAVLAAARLLGGADYDPSGFKFTNHPQLRNNFTKFFNSFNNSLGGMIRNGMRQEWELSNGKNDAMVESIIGTDRSKYKNYFSSNGPAMDAFLKRQRDGLKLSDRVWNLTTDFKDRLESGVNSGIGGGRGARLIAKDMMDYLQTPAQVGPGVYSDPKKNAQRLSRTETNMAYHAADYERWQQMDFVIGYEVEVSNNGRVCPLCLQLQGKYPKWFKFVGWHPHCFCHATAILADDIDAVENDPNEVTHVPSVFAKWVKDNEQRSIGKKQPYFVRDNFNGGKVTGGLLRPGSMPKVALPEKEGKLNHVIELIDKSKVNYLEVKHLPKPLSENEIIDRISGGDKTKGSCSSLAFAYAGNKAGYDVLDFRDGYSRMVFSQSGNIMKIAENAGGVIAKNTNDFTKAKELLGTIQKDREYYFSCGRHAAVVRKTDRGYEYLELQSAMNNGFKPLTSNELKNRFGAKKSHTLYRRKYETKDCIIDVDLLKEDSYFRELLGYINTNVDKQIKGLTGVIK